MVDVNMNLIGCVLQILPRKYEIFGFYGVQGKVCSGSSGFKIEVSKLEWVKKIGQEYEFDCVNTLQFMSKIRDFWVLWGSREGL